MKKKFPFILACILVFTKPDTLAQNWLLGGNALPVGGSSLGSNNSRPVIFETNNIERGRISPAGLWGLGVNNPTAKLHINAGAGINPLQVNVGGLGVAILNSDSRFGIGSLSPTAKLQVNSNAGEDALTVQINGNTRLYVHNGGGVSIGSPSVPPANGLFVSGNTGIGTTAPEGNLHVLRASAGATTANGNAPLVVENSTSNYINLLTPAANESGVLFGNPETNAHGGIIYNNGAALDGLQFRTNGNVTRMTLNSAGNLNITGDLDVGGSDVSFGSVETLSDAGANTIGCNSNFNPTSNAIRDLGSAALQWSDLFLSGSVQFASDARLKENIRDLDFGLQQIMKVRVVKYNLKDAKGKGDQLGVIAQELQKVLPELVTDYALKVDEETGRSEKVPAPTLSVKYIEFIPLLIKSLQEQQKTIQMQEERITKLEAALNNATTGKTSINNNLTGVSLEQNQPNPFNQTTLIRYKTPPGSNAQINVYDASGVLIKTMRANENGQSQLNGGDLKAGTYSYTLMVNGKTADSKKLILAR